MFRKQVRAHNLLRAADRYRSLIVEALLIPSIYLVGERVTKYIIAIVRQT